MPGDWTFPPSLRYFECIVPAANTAKWWAYRITSDGTDRITVVVSWGRIGTTGDSDPKGFTSASSATRFAEDKVREKLRKGYVARDEAWARRTWTGTRPPFAVDAKDVPFPKARYLAPGPQPPVSVRTMRAEEAFANIRPRVAVNPGRLKPREAVPARAAKRVIDFTEE